MKNNPSLSKKRKRFPVLGCFLIISLILIELSSLPAQTNSNFENRLAVLRNSFNKESEVIDSLKHVLNQKVNEIDYMKGKNGDENIIRKMMAGTVTISNKIDDHQKKITVIEKELEEIKKLLSKRYSEEIDSLANLENSNQFEGNKSDLKSRIITLTEKKILAAPKINSLSFNPEKILSINLSTAISPDEKKIYTEYLNSALSEVNNQLIQVKNISNEINQILTLQRKTKKFLEESEFDFDLKTANISSRSNQMVSEDNPTVATTTKALSYQTVQVQSFFVLLKQLDLKQLNDFNTQSRFSFDIPNKKISIKEYRELLNEVEKRLSDYSMVLTHKLNLSK